MKSKTINILIILTVAIYSCSVNEEFSVSMKHKFDLVENDTIFYSADKFAEYPSGEIGLRRHIAMEFKNCPCINMVYFFEWISQL